MRTLTLKRRFTSVRFACEAMMASLQVISIIVLITVCAVTAVGQRFTFQSYGQRDGLQNLDINCIYQDHNGTLWVGTEFGLYRYDGTQFELVPTVEGRDLPFIFSVVEDAKQRLWVSTPHALLYLSAAGMREVGTDKPPLNVDLRSPVVVLPGEPDRVYFTSQHRLRKAETNDGGANWQILPVFDSVAVSRFPALKAVGGVYGAANGHLWLGCGDQICEVASGTIRTWTQTEGLPADHWRAMRMDDRGTLWARGDHHVARLSAGSGRFLTEDAGLVQSALQLRSPCILNDSLGRILINVAKGVARWDNGVWTIFSASNGIPSGSIQTMFFDRQGSLWLDGQGLNRWLGYDNFENWTTDTGLSNNTIWAVLRDHEKRLWLGTELSLEELLHKHSRVQEGAKLNVRQVQTVVETTDHHLWTGSDNGEVAEYDPANRKLRHVGNLRNIYELYVDSSARLWVLATSGLFDVDATHRLRPVAPSILPSLPFYRVQEGADGSLLFAGEPGIYRLAKNKWTLLHLPQNYRPTFNTQVAKGADGTLWITGTSPTLLHARIDGDQIIPIESFSKDVLFSNNIYMLSVDRRGWIWVGTDQGIEIFNGTEWRRCTRDDGLIGDDIDTGAFYADEDGSVWIGTSGGLSHILHPEKVFAREDLRVKATEVRLGGNRITTDQVQPVAWNHSSLSVHLASQDFAHQSGIAFRYRLEGLEDNWTETRIPEIRYAQLPWGRYRFAAYATNSGRNQQSATLFLNFEILPPWWQTNWFYALLAACALCFAWILWRWSNRVVIRRQQELEHLVRERTRELEDKNTALLAAEAALIRQATHDSLTGLLNRGVVMEELRKELNRALREHTSLAAVLVDIDHFKKINDTYGHPVGDVVLRVVAGRLRSALRAYDCIGRYGGEEFLVVMPGADSSLSTDRLTELRRSISDKAVVEKDLSLTVTASFGATWANPNHDVESLIRDADQALYRAKANGRNRVEIAGTVTSSEVSGTSKPVTSVTSNERSASKERA